MAQTPTKRPAAKATPAQPRLKKFLVYLDPGDHERLRRMGFEQKRSIASLVREAVGEYLRRRR